MNDSDICTSNLPQAVNNNLELQDQNASTVSSIMSIELNTKQCNECNLHDICHNHINSSSIVETSIGIGVGYDKDTNSLDSGCECNSSNGSGKLENLEMTETCHSGPDAVPRRCKIANGDGDDISLERRREEELVRRRSASILEVKEHAHARLRDELLLAQEELKLKDEECKKLSRVHDQMSEELEELTAKLFEEANKMVQDANIKRMNSEKFLSEAKNKIEVLQAEVTALKTLVITSTPSMPNRHLHPQLGATPNPEEGPSFVKGHRRSTSHHNFTKEMKSWDMSVMRTFDPRKTDDCVKEVDPAQFEEFQKWRNHPSLKKDAIFMSSIMNEDILPCMTFTNAELSHQVFQCVLNNTLTIEPVHERNPFPRRCALTQATRICKFRVKLADADPYYPVSQLARNRIAAVCDFITYARYITQGLVKSDEGSMYWEIMRLRKQMSLARLGFS